MTLETVREYVASLDIAKDDNCYMGRMDNKKKESIGVYKLKRSGAPKIPIGGMQNAHYEVYPVSILVHWNQSPRETEKVAVALFEALRDLNNAKIEDTVILFCELLVPEPVDVGSDDAGICEMVIEVLFYCER